MTPKKALREAKGAAIWDGVLKRITKKKAAEMLKENPDLDFEVGRFGTFIINPETDIHSVGGTDASRD